VHTQRPERAPRGEVILVHGLEGSSDSGYMRGLSQQALEARFITHRLNLRGCGGTEFLAPTLYHAGLTTDLFSLLIDLDRQQRTPVFLVGFSIGGNLVLKMAGELGEDANRLIAGVCAVSTPIDLTAAARRLGEPGNRLYDRWFLRSMKRRLRRRNRVMPDRFPLEGLNRVSKVLEFDDLFTAPHSGFRGALHYYQTQSATRFLADIRVPALLIQAKDDPLIPFRIFHHPAIADNRRIELLATDHGGHMGFLSRRRPLLWLDRQVVAWMLRLRNEFQTGAVL